jgi:hypothetical protein
MKALVQVAKRESKLTLRQLKETLFEIMASKRKLDALGKKAPESVQ